jgi:hypothetical protein
MAATSPSTKQNKKVNIAFNVSLRLVYFCTKHYYQHGLEAAHSDISQIGYLKLTIWDIVL